MTAPDDPVGAGRATDAEREQAAQVVRRAVADEHLTPVEGEARMARVHASVHRGELLACIRDLGPVVENADRSASAVPPATGAEPATSSFSLMRANVRRGAWAPGPEHSTAAVLGGVELDLREARLDPRGTTIRAVALMGGIVIIVGPQVEVRCEGRGLMGGFADLSGPPTVPPPPGTPPLTVTGLAAWGGVEIRRRDRDRVTA